MDEVGHYKHPLLNLNLEELWEEVEEEDTAHELKGSTGNGSLSRYHSCPQLYEENKVMTQSFEATADDSSHLVALTRRKYSLHTGRLQTYEPYSPGSSTPTPPSSPRSARNSRSSAQDSPLTPIQSQSNFSSPDHFVRNLQDQEGKFNYDDDFQDRDSFSSSSSDSDKFKKDDNIFEPSTILEEPKEKLPLSTDRKRYIKRDNKYSKVMFNGTADDRHHTHGKSGTADKCSKWLQTVKMSQTEKIKSRSHVQLPPS